MIVKQILFFNKQPSTTLWFWVRAGKDRVSYWRRQPSFSATYILGSKTTFSWVGFFAFAGLKQSKSGRKGIWSCNFAKKSLANKVLNIAFSTSEFRFSITCKAPLIVLIRCKGRKTTILNRLYEKMWRCFSGLVCLKAMESGDNRGSLWYDICFMW